MSEFASTFLDKAGKRGFGFETGRHTPGKPGHREMRGVFEDSLQDEMHVPPFARAFEGAHPAVGTAARLGNPLRFKIEVHKSKPKTTGSTKSDLPLKLLILCCHALPSSNFGTKAASFCAVAKKTVGKEIVLSVA